MMGVPVQIASASAAAANMITQSYAAIGAAVSATAQDPSAASISAQSQVNVQTQIGTSVLKTALSIEATTAAQLTQMISQGAGINIQA